MPRKKTDTPQVVGATDQLTLGIASDVRHTTGSVSEKQTPLGIEVGREPAPVAQLVTRFHALYLAAYGTKPAIPPRFLRELKAHVERTGTSDALDRLERLFAGEGPRWLRPPYDLETYTRHFDKLAIAANPRPSDLLRGER